MTSGDHRPQSGELDGSGLTVAIVRARWNEAIGDRLIAGARQALTDASVSRVVEHSVAGAFELPLAAQFVATIAHVDAVVVVGVVIRGETTHYELVGNECARGVQHVQLTTGVPIGFGVLTVEDEAQALARSEPDGGHNVGAEAAEAAVEQARLRQTLLS